MAMPSDILPKGPLNSSSLNRYIGALLVIISAIGDHWLSISGALAQDASGIAPVSSPVNMDRAEWQERVENAKRRAKQFALKHQGRSVNLPSVEEREQVATERVLRDDSLQRGDIVSTNKGLFLFKGQPDQERHESDFVPLSSR